MQKAGLAGPGDEIEHQCVRWERHAVGPGRAVDVGPRPHTRRVNDQVGAGRNALQVLRPTINAKAVFRHGVTQAVNQVYGPVHVFVDDGQWQTLARKRVHDTLRRMPGTDDQRPQPIQRRDQCPQRPLECKPAQVVTDQPSAWVDPN